MPKYQYCKIKTANLDGEEETLYSLRIVGGIDFREEQQMNVPLKKL